MKQLDEELKKLNEEYDSIQGENGSIQSEIMHLKDINRQYVRQINEQESTASEENEGSIGEIHSMYQDLFLNDMKKELTQAQQKLVDAKQEQSLVQREITTLKKEHANLEATLNRYRVMVREISDTVPKELNDILEDQDTINTFI